jgi:dipeptidyl aminopeptidase/acylaminoacyl peptidase
MARMNKKRRLLVWLALGLFLGAGGYFLVWPKRAQELAVEPPAVIAAPTLAEQLPAELYRLTIPYLRERTYQSHLVDDGLLEETARYTARSVHYYSDGFQINGLLALPRGTMPEAGWPLVILVHGYLNPQTYQTNGQSYRAWWQAVANSGRLAVFKPDLRGHGQSQGYPSGAYYGSDYIVDVLTARQVLSEQDYINSEAIGLWGHSMGGNVVWRALAAAPDIRAVSLWAGAGYTYQDLRTYRISDSSYVPQSPRPTPTPTMAEATSAAQANSVRAALFDRESEIDYQSPFWQAMLPTNFMSELQGAVQLQHASDDEVVNVGYSRDLVALLQTAGVPHEYWEYGAGGHNLTASFNTSVQRMLDFFTTNLSASASASGQIAVLQ